MKSVIFLDRDGVLNVDINYLHRKEDLVWIEGVVEGLRYAASLGYEFIVVTNQSGVARGIYTEDDVKALHRHMQAYLETQGVSMLDFYYCPHHIEAEIPAYAVDCECRKPKPGLLLKAMKEHDVDPSRSIMIGDHLRDVEAGVHAGVKSFLFPGGNFAVWIESVLEGRETPYEIV